MSAKDSKIISYLDRRSDLINILGSLIPAISLGIIAGRLLKKYLIDHISYKYTPRIPLEWLFEVGLIVIIMMSIISIWTILNEHWRMTLFEIHRRNSEKKKSELLTTNFLEIDDRIELIDRIIK